MSEEYLNEVLEEINSDFLSKDLVQDNKLKFFDKGKLYQVRMPNQRELSEANEYRTKEFHRLRKIKGNVFKKQLIKELKEDQNIDIVKIDDELERYAKDLMQTRLTLASKRDSEKDSIKKLKEQIQEIKNNRLKLILEKIDYLAPCIEYQTEDGFYRYLAHICTEEYQEEVKDNKKVGIWKQVWPEYKNFQEDITKLPLLAVGKLNELMVNVE